MNVIDYRFARLVDKTSDIEGARACLHHVVGPPKVNALLSFDGVPGKPAKTSFPVPPTVVARLPLPNATTSFGWVALAVLPRLAATLPAPPPASTTLLLKGAGSLAMLNAALPMSLELVPASANTLLPCATARPRVPPANASVLGPPA
jgi:hypothetical protein